MGVALGAEQRGVDTPAIPRVQYHVLDTGYCIARENHIMRGGAHREVHCHSIVALLRHPTHGWLMWDAGYSPRMLSTTARLPYLLYRYATPLRLDPRLAAVAQLARLSLTPADIKHVIISHFHADHIAGLRDFPDARLITRREAYDDVRQRRGLRALKRAFIPALLPADFRRRATLLPHFTGEPLPGLGPTHDLFGDGSILLVELPGHAKGQIGMLANTEDGPVLFAADACWLTQQIALRRMPSPLTYFFIDSPPDLRSTLDGLHTFATARPDVTIVPSHCPQAFQRFVVEREKRQGG